MTDLLRDGPVDLDGIDPEELVVLARDVAAEAATFVAARRPEGRVEVAATKSSPTDVVTELDQACEELVRTRLLAARPADTVVGEEGADHVGDSGVSWIVDPIDGTVNFVYGIPAYAVSVAAAVDGAVVAGVVVNIATGEQWGAVRDGGAWTWRGDERRPVLAPAPPPVSRMLVGTGFSYTPELRAEQGRAVASLLPRVRDVRRQGAAALDLCAVASGRLDAYVEQGLQPWDLAAGGLVAKEAGLRVAGLDGPAGVRLVMAAHPAVSEEYFALVRTCGF